MARSTCSIKDCGRPAVGWGWCSRHWWRWRTHGDPLAGRTEKGAPQAFIDSVIAGSAPVEPNGCILWPYYVSTAGYAEMYQGDRIVGRTILEHFAGPAPTTNHTAGHAPHDVCGHRECIAPEHLSWQTPAEQAENKQRDGTTNVKFSDSQVLAAIARVKSGETQSAVAADLGASHTTVRLWVTGALRGHLTDPDRGRDYAARNDVQKISQTEATKGN